MRHNTRSQNETQVPNLYIFVSKTATLLAMRRVSRGLLVVASAAFIGAFIRMRSKAPINPGSGGWRELQAPDFR